MSSEVVGTGLKNLDHVKELAGKPRRNMSEQYRGKGRFMIKKLLPWSRKNGNDPNRFVKALIGAIDNSEDVGCEIFHEGQKDIHSSQYSMSNLQRHPVAGHLVGLT